MIALLIMDVLFYLIQNILLENDVYFYLVWVYFFWGKLDDRLYISSSSFYFNFLDVFLRYGIAFNIIYLLLSICIFINSRQFNV